MGIAMDCSPADRRKTVDLLLDETKRMVAAEEKQIRGGKRGKKINEEYGSPL